MSFEPSVVRAHLADPTVSTRTVVNDALDLCAEVDRLRARLAEVEAQGDKMLNAIRTAAAYLDDDRPGDAWAELAGFLEVYMPAPGTAGLRGQRTRDG